MELKDDEHKADWEKEHLCIFVLNLITTGNQAGTMERGQAEEFPKLQ